MSGDIKISLLSALPHSLSDVERAQGNLQKDYVRSILGGFWNPAEEVWGPMAPLLGQAARELFEASRILGVEVVKPAGRKELAAAALASDIVIVLAHWKGPHVMLLPADVLLPVVELDSTIDACIERGMLADDFKTNLAQVNSEAKARDILAQGLNDAIDRWWEWVQFDGLAADGADGADAMAVSSQFGISVARAKIDDIFGPKSLLPGSRLELDDGLWRPSDVATCFGTDWGGVCDFVCCMSAYLAEEVWIRHPQGLFRADSRLLYPK